MRFHHIGIITKDINQSLKNFQHSLNWEKSSKIIIDPKQKTYICFMKDFDGISYELIQPIDEQSPVSNLIDRKISLYHVCYEVEELSKSIALLSSKGFLQISEPSEAKAFKNRRIVFLINQDNFIIELVEKHS